MSFSRQGGTIMKGRMEQKAVIVTGASKGIGRGIAEVFAAEGAKVLVVGRNETDCEKLVKSIQTAGGQASSFRADVQNWRDVEAMAAAAVDRYGRIDVLCNNAGIYPAAHIENMTSEQWDNVHSTNLKGTFLTVKACLSQMKKQKKGRIVLTSSITGPITGYPGWSHYGATKAGMLGFMRTAAIEFAKDGITINAVLPGNIRTEGLDDVGDEYIRSMEKSIPMAKLGSPQDIAYAMLFLASGEAGYITGQTLVVDGGQTLPESLMALS